MRLPNQFKGVIRKVTGTPAPTAGANASRRLSGLGLLSNGRNCLAEYVTCTVRAARANDLDGFFKCSNDLELCRLAGEFPFPPAPPTLIL